MSGLIKKAGHVWVDTGGWPCLGLIQEAGRVWVDTGGWPCLG
jgi:hypothetical protein